MWEKAAGVVQARAFPARQVAGEQERTTQPDMIWFHSVVERYRDTVFRVAFTYLKNSADADDVCQDTFVALYRSGRDFEGEDHLKAWLIRVAINRCKSMLSLLLRGLSNQ